MGRFHRGSVVVVKHIHKFFDTTPSRSRRSGDYNPLTPAFESGLVLVTHLYPVECSGSNLAWLVRLGPKKLCGSTWFSWVPCSGKFLVSISSHTDCSASFSVLLLVLYYTYISPFNFVSWDWDKFFSVFSVLFFSLCFNLDIFYWLVF